MTFDTLSPLDSRYRNDLFNVRNSFSEFALMKARCQVEILHLLNLNSVFGELTRSQISQANLLCHNFNEEDFFQIKNIEDTIKHDVKAVEVFLRSKLELDNPNRVHFGLTSEDVNNLAWTLCIKEFKNIHHIDLLKDLVTVLIDLCDLWKNISFPARTHGQLATPTTAGKELAVFINRLTKNIVVIRDHKFYGKLNGATGTYAAMMFAAPNVDWISHEQTILESLNIERNTATTQVEDCGSICEYLDKIRVINNILIDMCQDIWMYISYGYIVQRIVKDEVGSSTMPHKVNPINFENAEGNLQLSNALLGFLTDKLSKSRMQRDLSNSTVMRNIGVAIGHHYLAIVQLQKGLFKIDINKELCLLELQSHPELLAEPIQTVLRTISKEDVYTQLKDLTRGKPLDESIIKSLSNNLPLDLKYKINNLSPSNYLGNCESICNENISLAKNSLRIW
jgi:adenylosuccinate lyase